MIRPYLSAARNHAGIETQRLRLALAREPTVLDASLPDGAVSDDPNVLFLCYGNICRSPLAERYLESVAEDRGIDGLSADSAGLRTTAGRASPDDAVRVADDLGVDLSDHRSKPVTAAHLERSDLVVVMDLLNYSDLRREFGDRDEKTRFLGVFSGEGYEIDDPYGQGIDGFQALYGDVIGGVDGLVRALESER
ncbi:protein tyrosine phosphatase [Halorubrum saccharovorum]|uniref:Protein tyrosine phosphatase n=1 Tax=Halorubrum saccharovorum TaxID=2248 RepID=A0A081EXB2_9EURY|nr:low molecular weight protein-tyrosine-phosphatase [Halorubrum saccharovorum]KDS92050.1 protein tyrosine phosphatase [Halorubrum saccharovorum]